MARTGHDDKGRQISDRSEPAQRLGVRQRVARLYVQHVSVHDAQPDDDAPSPFNAQPPPHPPPSGPQCQCRTPRQPW